MSMTISLLVVVQVVDVDGMAGFEPKDHAPVGAHEHGPKPGIFALQPVQPQTGQVQVSRGSGRVQSRQECRARSRGARDECAARPRVL